MENQNPRIPNSPPIIPALASERSERPLWSVMIPAYNCSQFLPEVLKSVLCQDMGIMRMQIEVIDDASTDTNVEDLVDKIGKGRIKYYRQKKNVGSLRNFETCINRAQGNLVHILHGDDRIKYGFYNEFTKIFNDYPQAGAAFCNFNIIDKKGRTKQEPRLEEREKGILNNWLVRIAEFQKIQFVSKVVRRQVYENLGSFYGMRYGEDWEMWVRIAKNYPIAFTPEVLAEYRTHRGSLTTQNVLSGITYNDMCKVINIIQGHVPSKEREKIFLKNKIHCAHYLLGSANNIWKETRNYKLTKSIVVQSLRLHIDFYSLARIMKLILIIVFNRKKKPSQRTYDSQSMDTSYQTKSFLV